MSDAPYSGHPAPRRPTLGSSGPASLADVLERVLDKGIVIAGDIRVDLLDIELLTIRIRLLISSADKAEELGMAWWRSDPFYTGQPRSVGDGDTDGIGDADALRELVDSTRELSERVARLERTDSDGDRQRSAARSASGSPDEREER